jgi:hypothetical protein
VKAAKDNALNLLEARAQLQIRKPAEIVDVKDGRVYLDAMVAPIDWLIATGSPVLANREESWSTLKTAAVVAGFGGRRAARSPAASRRPRRRNPNYRTNRRK